MLLLLLCILHPALVKKTGQVSVLWMVTVSILSVLIERFVESEQVLGDLSRRISQVH